ncbi:MAG: sugar phosphate nucleotidyltransferase [Thermoleophilia bacterium]
MRAMIMAAGLGTRLMPLTATLPKPMVPIVGRPALGHILDLLRRHGVTEVVVNLHHFPDTIRAVFGDGAELGMSIAYSYEEELLGTAGGVKNNQAFLEGGTFVVMSGDSLTDVDLTRLVTAHRDSGGICSLGVMPVGDTTEYGVVVLDEQRRVLGFQEKPAPEDALSDLCNCGIYVFEPEIFQHIPADTFYDFGRQVFHDLLAKDVAFHAHTISGYWSDVGGLDAYRAGNFDALTGAVMVEVAGAFVADTPGSEALGPAAAGPAALERHPGGGSPRRFIGEGVAVAATARIEGPVYMGPGCTVEEHATLIGPVVIAGGCVIGAGSRIAETILWEDCRVDADCVVEGSVFARGVRVAGGAHVRRAVLGEDCRVAAGCSIEDQALDPGATVDR